MRESLWIFLVEALVVDVLRVLVGWQGFSDIQRRTRNQKQAREENDTPNSPVQIGSGGGDAEKIEHLSGGGKSWEILINSNIVSTICKNP